MSLPVTRTLKVAPLMPGALPLTSTCLCAGLLALVCGLLAVPASGSTIVARDASNVRLAVDGQGRALVTYSQDGKRRRVLAWGAINGQTTMRLDYSGGSQSFGAPLWRSFDDRSRAYDGPKLTWLVTARKAPDGSYWALQAWRRLLPNQGRTPVTSLARAVELHLSHWRGPLPRLSIWLDWIDQGTTTHLFGRYTYRGKGVFGYSNTPAGNPLDPYGRNIYVDTRSSAYGPGWERENSFLTHRPRGTFCYGFYARGIAVGTGDRYRATAIGPGAAPDPYWEAPSLGAYDPALDRMLDDVADRVLGDDPRCQAR